MHQRGDDRAQLSLDCDLRVGSLQWHQATLLDLTTDGFRVKLTHRPNPGEPVRIRMAGLSPLEAEVCWWRDFEAGCRFVQPLSPYVFEHILRLAGRQQ